MTDVRPDVTRARLIGVRVPRRPEAAVLVLHGGASRGDGVAVNPRQLSVLRMIPIARRIALAGRGRLAVYRLLNSSTGWSPARTPVADVQWALEQLRSAHGPELSFGLVGHSLGGRTALLSAGEEGVRSVVALAPWVYTSDDPQGVAGRQFLIVHGTRDTVADPDKAAVVARRIERQADLGFVRVEGATHDMLRHHRQFDGLAAAFTTAVLLDRPGRGTVARVLGGEHWLQL